MFSFLKKKKHTAPSKEMVANAFCDLPDFLAEAEHVLQNPEPLLLAYGISPTPMPLRALLASDGGAGLNALVTLLHGPSTDCRKLAAFALAQVGNDHTEVVEILRKQKLDEMARGNIGAIQAAIDALRLAPASKCPSELNRRRAVQNLYGGRAWDLGFD